MTVLSLLDPVRVAEDYATLDQLSGGRLDIIIGKGNDPDQNALFGYDIDGQWDRNAEKYELLRQLIREEKVTWSGGTVPTWSAATTQPRPLQDPLPIWHGSASSTESTELAAKWGDPLFSANGFHPLAKYAALIDHYRQRWVDYGRDPADAVVGAGFNGLYVGKTSQQALEIYRPIFAAFMASPGAIHNKLPFSSLEEFLETGLGAGRLAGADHRQVRSGIRRRSVMNCPASPPRTLGCRTISTASRSNASSATSSRCCGPPTRAGCGHHDRHPIRITTVVGNPKAGIPHLCAPQRPWPTRWPVGLGPTGDDAGATVRDRRPGNALPTACWRRGGCPRPAPPPVRAPARPRPAVWRRPPTRPATPAC